MRCAINFLAENGPFDVQAQCLLKTVSIQLDPFDEFDFGVVSLGEETEHVPTIRNNGALQAVWSVSLEPMTTDPGFLSLQEAEDGVIQFFIHHGVTEGYSLSQVCIGFQPSRPAQLRFGLPFKFSSFQSESDQITKEIPLKAIGADVSVFSESDRIDFGLWHDNELYRSTLIAQSKQFIGAVRHSNASKP
jgi:hypothetical protein